MLLSLCLENKSLATICFTNWRFPQDELQPDLTDTFEGCCSPLNHNIVIFWTLSSIWLHQCMPMLPCRFIRLCCWHTDMFNHNKESNQIRVAGVHTLNMGHFRPLLGGCYACIIQLLWIWMRRYCVNLIRFSAFIKCCRCIKAKKQVWACC